MTRALFFGFLFGVLSSVSAHELPLRYNVIELQADAQREVQNDTMTATLFAEQTGFDPAQVADGVNKVVNEASRIAKAAPRVKVKSGYNQSFPVYGKNNQLQGWRTRSEIRLESADFEATSALIGKLQSTLRLASLGFSVSPEARRKAEDELIKEAIERFRERAEIVKQSLGGAAYKLQRMSVNTSGAPPVRPFTMRAAEARQDVAAPEVEGGTSQITVAATGAIEVD